MLVVPMNPQARPVGCGSGFCEAVECGVHGGGKVHVEGYYSGSGRSSEILQHSSRQWGQPEGKYL